MHRQRNRHLNDSARSVNAFSDGEAWHKYLTQAPSFAECDAKRHIARLRAAAGEHQIAEARKTAHRLAACAERRTEAHHLGKASRDEGGVGACAKFLAGDDAGGDGIDILERT